MLALVREQRRRDVRNLAIWKEISGNDKTA
jgi:hypothetical protein